LSVSNTLAERGERYGQFADHARIAQGIQDVMRAAPKWPHLDQDMKQALSVIADKIARILNGDPFYGDNWHDIQGYAKLVEDRINMIPDAKQELFEIDPELMRKIQEGPNIPYETGTPKTDHRGAFQIPENFSNARQPAVTAGGTTLAR